MLSRDDILKAKDLATETVEVPEWGGSVIVQAMSGKDRDSFEIAVYQNGERDLSNVRARICSMSIVGEDGEKLFTPEDIALLGEKNGLALDKIFTVAKRLSGIGKKEIDLLKKNS